jgi:hypothetical protein
MTRAYPARRQRGARACIDLIEINLVTRREGRPRHAPLLTHDCRCTVLFPMPDEDIKAELERLRAENDRLKTEKKSGRAMSLKVSEKGGVSVYGLGRFPVTLYKEQWAKLLDMADEIRAFIKENEPKLKTKGEE